MKRYPEFHATEEDVIALLAAQRMGRLVTIDSEGSPTVGLHVFVHEGTTVELHLANDDVQLADLRARPAVFEVDDVLSQAPSSWHDPHDATHAEQLYRTATLRGRFEISSDPESLAKHLRGIVARYQPGEPSTPVTHDHEFYAGAIRSLSLVRLSTPEIVSKFKLSQSTEHVARERILAGLEQRGTPLDQATATAIRNAKP